MTYPQVVEMERAVLGAPLLRDEHLEVIAAELTERDFSDVPDDPDGPDAEVIEIAEGKREQRYDAQHPVVLRPRLDIDG